MSITQDLASVVTAANTLTQEVTNKIGSIDQRVNQFETDAKNITNAVTDQLKRAKIGVNQAPYTNVIPGPDDDTGVLVRDAFANGYKFVAVSWEADGKDRHWNTMVSMPEGATLSISGPISDVQTLGGNVRSGYSSYANGQKGGTSELGSPMIFRNLEASFPNYPNSSYFKTYDEASLFQMSGNNTILFSNGTFVFDTSGIGPHPYGSAMIRMGAYVYDMPCFVGGGGHHAQFYLGGPFLNNCGSTSTCDIRMMKHHIAKLSSDGPTLTADKGYRRLMDKGISGITPELLRKQSYEITEAEAALNDVDYPGVNYSYYTSSRGLNTESDRPRLVTFLTWGFGSGWTFAQFLDGKGECSYSGLNKVAEKEIYLGTYS